MKKLLILLLLVAFIPSISIAAPKLDSEQTSIIKSGEQLIEDARKDWKDKNFGSGMEKIEKAITTLQGTDHHIKVKAQIVLAEFYTGQMKLDKAEEILVKAELDARKYYNKLSSFGDNGAAVTYSLALIRLGSLYVSTNRLEDGLAKMEEGIKISQKHNDRIGLVTGAVVLGNIYIELERYEDAEKILLLAEKETKKFEDGDEFRMILPYQSLYGFYTVTKDWKKALEYLEKLITTYELKKNPVGEEHLTFVMYAQLIELHRTAGLLYSAKEVDNKEAAISHYKEAIELSEHYRKQNWATGQVLHAMFVQLHLEISDVYTALNKPTLSEENLRKASELADELKLPAKNIASIHREVGIALDLGGKSKEAISYFAKEYDYYKSLNDKDSMMGSLLSMGIAASKAGVENDYYEQAKKIAVEMDDKKSVAEIDNNIAYGYARNGKFQKALPYAESSYSYYSQYKDSSMYPVVSDTIGYVHYGLGNYEEAKKYILEAVEQNSINSDSTRGKDGLGNNYQHLGLVYLKQGDKKIGCENLSKSKEYFVTLANDKKISELEELLSSSCIN
ncbi:MAG: hypothetical protein COV36_07345 [Alphaproteobacteria bacterium CG11_big_fil_rev_8_21_14_0_20_44_7]|nr:MAG: hypothetical protein COV36_07345 [Alphaproteobacteria bacterium CG11_big_fil_rev_8_21_14_0_20_44_7]